MKCDLLIFLLHHREVILSKFERTRLIDAGIKCGAAPEICNVKSKRLHTNSMLYGCSVGVDRKCPKLGPGIRVCRAL